MLNMRLILLHCVEQLLVVPFHNVSETQTSFRALTARLFCIEL